MSTPNNNYFNIFPPIPVDYTTSLLTIVNAYNSLSIPDSFLVVAKSLRAKFDEGVLFPDRVNGTGAAAVYHELNNCTMASGATLI